MHDERLVEHLTKEIELAAQAQVSQRSRNNLIVALGPYLLLGAYIAAVQEPPDLRAIALPAVGTAFSVFILGYVALGWLAATIEARLWDQSNHWRAEIAKITKVPPETLHFDPRGLHASYMWIYGVLAAIFCAILYLLSYT